MDDNYQEALRRIEKAERTRAKSLSLRGMRLTALPEGIGELSALTELDLSANQLTALPEEIGQLSALTYLDLRENQLTELPEEIVQLSALTYLYLSANQLTELPEEIVQLSALTRLYLSTNQLTELPEEIVQLSALTELDLRENQLTELPEEIVQLSALTYLDLRENQLTALPPEIIRLTNLAHFYFEGNFLPTPSPEIETQGLQAILKYLSELSDSQRQWTSKLIIVGEGGTGKTATLRRLLNEGYDPKEETTHGIRIRELELEHPDKDMLMTLKAWDFGGQEIYHATHQFFLTNRSLFLLAWRTRLGYEAGKLYYWLDTIKALAPDSPVILVAVGIDERPVDIPLAEFRQKYPQVVGQVAVSNKTGEGIKELRDAVRETAANLPLMGEAWPTAWLEAATEVRNHPKQHVTARELWDVMDVHGVAESSRKVLATWLHELGDVLFFQDDEELHDTVILEPVWVSEYISEVLDSDDDDLEVFGIFTRALMDELWEDLPPIMRNRFLRLMEKFDLSYRIPEDPEDRSLVVERLSADEVNYRVQWDAIQERDGCCEMNMRYVLNSTVPAGIPTWFIARTHRFTLKTHWRGGALFGDRRKDYDHLGLVRAFPHQRYIEITVRGPHPYDFFALLRDGFEVTLARFPGLEYRRLIPCPGHNGEPCGYEFDYESLLNAYKKLVMETHCQEAFEYVSVPLMLFGVDYGVTETVITVAEEQGIIPVERGLALQPSPDTELVLGRLASIEGQIIKMMSGMMEMAAFMQRGFAEIFEQEQKHEASETPYVFTLSPREGKPWTNILGQETELQLFCNQPGHWHPVGKPYIVREPKKRLQSIGGHMGRLVKVFKYMTPIPGTSAVAGNIEKRIERTEELARQLSNMQSSRGARDYPADEPGEVRGAMLAEVRKLLLELDPKKEFRGLRKLRTPEGHYLWLCDKHREEYR